MTLGGRLRRPQVSQIEPVIPIVLGLHGLAISVLTAVPDWAAGPFLAIVGLGVVGVAGWTSYWGRLVRAVACTAVPLALSIEEPSVVPAVLQWYYAVATIYPLILVGWTAAAIGPMTGAAYVTQVLAGAAPVPLEVAGLRAGVLTLLGLAAGTAGIAFRAAVQEAQEGREVAERTGRELAFAATHDELTGLGNRARLHEAARVALTEQGRLAMMLIDLDLFKEVNDALGHRYGDELLRQVATRLSAAAPPDVTITRLGGDEFAVLVPDGDATTSTSLAEHLRSVLEEPFQLEDAMVAIDASIGIALAPDHAADSDQLMQLADVAMYAAKGNGLGSAVYRPVASHRGGRLTLLAELRSGIGNGELVVEYQPMIRICSGQPVACEGLVRWQHPALGRVMPDDFIPLAERSGLIRPLTAFVLEDALGWCASWHGTRVSVNLSARNLQQSDLPALVGAALARHGVAADMLELEITESFLMSDPVAARALLLELNELGVRVAVDDFGTGLSSLSYLKNLPVDVLKIDKSFVTQMLQDQRDWHIVRGIVDLANGLGIETVAEGVEDPATLHSLGELGCSYAQGYGISRPISAQSVSAWLTAQGARPPRSTNG